MPKVGFLAIDIIIIHPTSYLLPKSHHVLTRKWSSATRVPILWLLDPYPCSGCHQFFLSNQYPSSYQTAQARQCSRNISMRKKTQCNSSSKRSTQNRQSTAPTPTFFFKKFLFAKPPDICTETAKAKQKAPKRLFRGIVQLRSMQLISSLSRQILRHPFLRMLMSCSMVLQKLHEWMPRAESYPNTCVSSIPCSPFPSRVINLCSLLTLISAQDMPQ